MGSKVSRGKFRRRPAFLLWRGRAEASSSQKSLFKMKRSRDHAQVCAAGVLRAFLPLLIGVDRAAAYGGCTSLPVGLEVPFLTGTGVISRFCLRPPPQSPGAF